MQFIKIDVLKSTDGGIWPLIGAAVLYDVGARAYEQYSGNDVFTFDDLF